MATPATNSIPLSGNDFIDGLTQGGSWLFSGDRVLTYSLHNDSGSWSGKEIKAITQAADAWAAVADFSLTGIITSESFFDSQADVAITATGTDLQNLFGAVGLACFPDTNFADDLLDSLFFTTRDFYPNPEGDMFIDDIVTNSFRPGGFDFETLMHEFGHALGLKHPHDDGANFRPTFTELGIDEYDNVLFTVMSYNDIADPFIDPRHGFVATPMPLDILAIQNIYGPNMNYRTGDDNYLLKDDGIVKTIWDAGGTDTINASKIKFSIEIDLNPGEFIYHGNKGSITAIAFDVTIENATGTKFGDILIGNDFDNILIGGKGDDFLDGGAMSDQLDGGNENDTLNGGSGTDTLIGGMGNDTLTGGLDTDVFIFGIKPGMSNVDTIVDFVSGADNIYLDDDIFTKLATLGTPSFILPSGNFVANDGAVAGDGDDFILYNSSTGYLFYDSDGNSGGTAVMFAVLSSAPALAAADIMVIA